MSALKRERQRNATRVERGCRALVAMVLFGCSFALLPATLAAAAGASIGVFVDQPTTTVPPVTAPPTTEAPATEEPTTGTVETPPTTVPITTSPTLPDVLPPQVQVESAPTGFVESAKKLASTTKRVVTDVLSGKPVADAFEAVLPASAAEVVVPAIRTASTFVFPIGLAGAVIAFLGLQQRIDSGDPKLTAAPLAHDNDEVTFL